jgi:hypothetical protein
MRTGPFCVPPTTAQVRGPAVDRSEVRAGRRRTTLALGVLAALAAVAAPTGSVDAGQASAPVAKLASCHRPADAVDLRNWSLTLPAPHSPVTVKQPQLATYSAEPFFAVRGCAIQFQTPVNSATTPNSRYPRSELREMTDGGRRKPAWSSSAGRHELDVDLAFTRLPAGKPHVVGAQVHDGSDDIVTLRLEGSKLWITHRNHSHQTLVTDAYRLGTRLRLAFVVQQNMVAAFVDGRLVATIDDTFDGGYFKTGAYVQANCSNSLPCSATNAGAVLVHALAVKHS